MLMLMLIEVPVGVRLLRQGHPQAISTTVDAVVVKRARCWNERAHGRILAAAISERPHYSYLPVASVRMGAGMCALS